MEYAGGCKDSDESPNLPISFTSLDKIVGSNPARSTKIKGNQMYSVNRVTHQLYGSIVAVERQENGSFDTPSRAVQAAIKERRLWKESGQKKVRILIDDQILTPNQAESWAHEEYKTLPKCKGCAKILSENLYTHQLCRSGFFCSQDCADKDYTEEIEKLKDEEEIDYL